MLKLCIAVSSLFFFYPSAFSQTILRGKVISEETQKPLASVSVYLNNTSLGNITNEDGVFIISKIPSGKFRLVASCLGFETYADMIDPRTVGKNFVISLKPKPEELPGLSITVPDPDGWKKWGKLFIELFIGDTPGSNDCKLTNPEVIKFRMNPDNTLTAYSKEPLQIINYNLGYEIKYKLEEFQYDFNIKMVNFSGYAFFTDMGIKHPNRVRRYIEARFETYKGSFLHFKRAFFANELDAQGFELRSLGNMSNPEKDRAKRMFSQHKDSVILDTVSSAFYAPIDKMDLANDYIHSTTVTTVDSTDHFRKMLLQPDSIISHQLISSDSIGFAADSTVAGMYFKDSLEVS